MSTRPLRYWHQPGGKSVIEAVLFTIMGATVLSVLVWAITSFWDGGGFYLVGALGFLLVVYLVALWLENI